MSDTNELNKPFELSAPENIELVTLSDIDSHNKHSHHHTNDFNSLQDDFTILENDKSRLTFQKQPDIYDMSNCSRENPTQGYTHEPAISESPTQHHKTEESTSQDTHSSVSAQQETEQCTCKSTSSFNASNYLPPVELNNSHHSNSSISILSESRTDSDSLTNNTSGSHIDNENSVSSECINDFTDGVHLELHDPNLSSSFITAPTKNCDKAKNDSCDKIIKSEEDLAIWDSEIPDKFRKAFCDAVIIYCEKDERDALLFRDVIEKFVTLEDGNKPRICPVDGDGYPRWGQSRFKQWEDTINGSTYMFLFITENFIHDTWAGLQFDECLQASIDEPDKRWCAVPVHSVNKNNCKFIVPWGIRCLKGLYIDQMFNRGKKLKLQEIDLSEINMGSLSPFFIKGMTELLNSKLHIKKNRIAAQEDTLSLWKEEEMDRRRIKLIQHVYYNEIRAAKAEKSRLLREELMLKNQQEALNRVQGMTTLDDSEPQESVVRTFHSPPNTAPCCVINITNSSGISIGPKNTQIVGQTSHGGSQSQVSCSNVCDSGDENSDLIVIERTHGQDINQEKPTQTTGQFEHDHATPSDATFVKSVE